MLLLTKAEEHCTNNVMFEYTHEVKGQDGFSWGVFPNESIAKIMHDELSRKFNPHNKFYIEEIV